MKDFIPIAQPLIGAEERSAVDRVLRSGRLAQGPEVAAFEREFSRHFGLGRACVAVNSGTSGLHLGLLSVGVRPGAEVIVPSFTFAGTANAVVLAGAVPVFADIDRDSFCLDPDSAEAAITERTVALMPVHLYGHPANMPALDAVARRHGLRVLEDAAQAHGAALDGVPVGSFGAVATFSLYPTKNMTSGEGGMVTAESAQVERMLRLYRNQGMNGPHESIVVGLNNRMTDIHAAIGRVQLTKIDAWTKQRQDNAMFLSQHLAGVITPPVVAGATHVFHQYTIRVPEDRDGFATALRAEYNIGAGVYYPTPVHRLRPYDRDLDLPETERAAGECLSLPVHPSLSEEHLERLIVAVNSLAGAGA